MNKKIINEIYRQQKIMGVTKPLLRENTYVTLGSDLIKSFINTSKKVIPNVVDDVLVGSVRVNKNFLNDIFDILENPSLFGVLNKSEKELFGQIVAQSSDIVDDIYEKLMKDVITQTGKSEKDLINMISKQTDGGKTLSEVLNELNGEEDIFLNSVLIQKISKKIRDIKTGKFSTEVKVGNKKFLDPTTGLEWSSAEVLQIQRQMNQFQKLLKKVGVSGATKWLKDSLKIYEPFWVQFIRNWYYNLIFNWKKVQQTNINKAKEFVQNAYKLEEEGKSSEAIRELQKALSQIIIFKKEPGTDINEIIEAFITQNPNLGTKTKEMFLNSDAAGNKTIKEFIEDIADDVHKQVTKPIKAETKSFIELIPSIGSIMKRTPDLSDSAKESLNTSTLQRWFNLVSWKDPRNAYEVILGMSKRGVKKEVSARILSYLMIHTLVIPALISLLKTWKNNIESSTKTTYLETLKKLCDEGYLTEGCNDINNELNSIQFMFSEDYVKNYLETLPIDLGKLFGGENWDEGQQLINEYPFFWTYWDDIINLIYDVVQGSPFPFIGKPKTDKVLNILENSQKKFSQELQKMGIDPNSKNLEQEVKNYYVKSGVSPNTNETTSKINIKEDIKPVVPCLFTGGWDVSLVNVNGKETYVTHNSDWTQKYYLDVVKNNNTTTVYYKGTNKNPCG